MSSENDPAENAAPEEEIVQTSAPESLEEAAIEDGADAPAEVAGVSEAPVEDAAASSAQEPETEGTATVDVNTQPKPEQPKKPILDDGANKIFVGGISQETTDDDLRAYFGQHGEIVDITIMKDRMTGKSRGFGFITFDTPEVADKMVASKHEINGRMVEAKPAVPRGSQAQMGMGQRPPPNAQGSDPSQRATKIFVGGLSPNVNDAELKDYFSQFGTVLEASVVVDKDTSRKRGFGFVSFSTYQTVDTILAKKEHNIMDKVVEVKKAFPKGAGGVPAMNRGPPIMPNRGGPYPGPRGYGGGGPGYYGGQDGGYNQQAPGYSYYGGYDHSGAGYQGYGQSGYGGAHGPPGYGAGYGDQQRGGHGGYSNYGGHEDASMHTMYGGHGAQTPATGGYDAQQQPAYNGYGASSYGAPATYGAAPYGGAAGYSGTAPYAGTAAYGTGATAYGAAAAAPAYGAAPAAAAAGAYGAYEDPNAAYNGASASAAARYHPYSR